MKVAWQININLSFIQYIKLITNLITNTKSEDHIKSLYKILFLTFKVLNGTAPVYLSDLIKKYLPVEQLVKSHKTRSK